MDRSPVLIGPTEPRSTHRRGAFVLGTCALLLAALAAGFEPVAAMQAPGGTGANAAGERQTPAPLAAQSAATAEMERYVLRRVNELRAKEGVGPLRENPALMSMARRFSREMAEKRFFDHVSPSGETLEQRFRDARLPFRNIGENIFRSNNLANPAQVAVDDWMKSAGHRQNILRAEFTETGVGVWQKGKELYFTQEFFRPR